MSESTSPPLSSFPPPPQPPRGSGMPGWVKYALIGCGGLLLLVIIAVVIGAIWFSKNADTLVERTGAIIEEGEVAGRETDEEGCMRLAAERPGGGLSGMVNEQFWLRGCLSAAAESPGFCEAVPGPTEFRRGIAWQREQCGNSGDTRCQQRAQTRQRYCLEGRQKTSDVDTYDGWDSLGTIEADSAGGWDSAGVEP